jgi:hypothetical protein
MPNMSSGERWVFGLLVVCVAGIAVWQGGALSLLGLVVAGLLMGGKRFLSWRDYRARYGDDGGEPRSAKKGISRRRRGR